MTTDQIFLEGLVKTAKAKQQRGIPVHAVYENEFDALCRAGAQPIQQWEDCDTTRVYCIMLEYRGLRFFYGSRNPIQIPTSNNAPA